MEPQHVFPHVDGYTIVRQLGSGTYGTVFLATASRLAAALNEAAVTSDVAHHPCVVDFMSSAPTRVRGMAAMVLGYADGGSLADVMRSAYSRRKSLTPAVAMHFATQLALALKHVHDAGYAHLDLKPANVLLASAQAGMVASSARWKAANRLGRQQAVVKLSDFGVAAVAPGPGEPRLTGLAGSPPYMAPEMLSGAGYGREADVFSFGVLLYELLAGGVRPFPGTTLETAGRAILTQRPAALPPHVPRELAAIVKAMLRKDPAARPTFADILVSPPFAAALEVLTAPDGALSEERFGADGSYLGNVAALEPVPPLSEPPVLSGGDGNSGDGDDSRRYARKPLTPLGEIGRIERRPRLGSAPSLFSPPLVAPPPRTMLARPSSASRLARMVQTPTAVLDDAIGLATVGHVAFVTGPGIAFGVLLAQFNGRANRTSEVLLQPQVFPAEIAAYTPWLNAITGPDVVEVYLGGGGLDLLSSDNFEDVTDIWTNSSLDLDLLPAAMASSTGADGRRYGVPLMGDANVCVYSKSAFAAMGITATPNTWSELKALCSVFVAAGKPCLGTGYDAIPSVYFDYMFIRMHGNAAYEQFFNGNVSFTDPRVNATFNVLMELKDIGAMMPDPTSGAAYNVADLVNDTIPIYCGFEMMTVSPLQQGANTSNLDVFPFPSYDGELGTAGPSEPTNAILGLVGTYAIPKNAQYKSYSHEFLTYATNPTVQAGMLSYATSGFIPRFSMGSYVVPPRAKKVYSAVLAADAMLFRSFAAFGFASVTGDWWRIIYTFEAMPTRAMAQGYLNTALAAIEVERLAAVLKMTVEPVADPLPGTYSDAVRVSLSSPTTGAVVYYTLDGSEVNLGSPVYSGPITISSSGTTRVRAIALAPGLRLSTELVGDYVLNIASVKDDSSARLLLYILIPSLLLVICVGGVVGYVIYRRKSVTYRLKSDSDLVLNSEDIDIGRAIGEGSFGTVYMGSWRGTAVAIKRTKTKVMKPAQLKEFVDEAGMLLRLRHPNIVIFMGVTLEPPQLVTEFMDRGSLYDIIHAPDVFLDTSIIFKWCHNMAQGLFFLQQSGVTHGDFKSLNVLFDSNWVPKICDFGMSSVKGEAGLVAHAASELKAAGKGKKKKTAKVTPADAAAAAAAGAGGDSSRFGSLSSNSPFVSATSSFSSRMGTSRSTAGGKGNDSGMGNVGTLFWAAPEVLTQGGAAASAASDAYSLGLTFWELAARSDLYPGENPLAVSLDVVNGRRPETASIRADLNDLLPVITGLWDGNAETRMTTKAAVEALGDLYSPMAVVYPTTATAPEGQVILIHVARLGIGKLLLRSPSDAAECLAAFHAEVPELAREAGGAVVEWGLATSSIAVHRGDQFGLFVSLLDRVEARTGPLAVAAVQGNISTAKNVYGEQTLSGEVMVELTSLWQATFGSRSAGEASLILAHGMPGVAKSGMFVRTEFANSLDKLPKGLVSVPVTGDSGQALAAAGERVTRIARPAEIASGEPVMEPPSPSQHRSDGASEERDGFTATPRRSSSRPPMMRNDSSKRDLNRSGAGVRRNRGPSADARARSSSRRSGSRQRVSSRRASVVEQEEDEANSSSSSSSSSSMSNPSSSSSQRQIRGKAGPRAAARISATRAGSSKSGAHRNAKSKVDPSHFILTPAEMDELVKQDGTMVHGSYSRVHEANWNGQPVMVKVLLRQDLKREGLINFAVLGGECARAQGTRIAGAIGLCITRPFLGLIFPRYDSGSLQIMLDRAMLGRSRDQVAHRSKARDALGTPTLDNDSARVVVLGLIKAIAELHEVGKRGHGSLRPANVMIVTRSTEVLDVHLIDYFLSKIKTNMGTMTMVPSVAYLAPENLRGEDGNMEADIFVFGTMLYEIAVRQPAFDGSNALEVGYHILSGFRPDLNFVEDPRLRELIADCWNDDAAARPKARDVAKRLEASLRERGLYAGNAKKKGRKARDRQNR
ncbi:uncharacterized protein AMSG_11954 [Thecamonas trahens ATCC 50062]|uniref:Protein kinase domain-containing protein n=1 Tax=Thecamonas trahens ATCC 50062 TaxID=461836 RepID=A0A0L0DC73_THETB|nr:hypothetical protein AMSG_11954 [Thecamonas trahens ATCC 50062]KNC49937.1 hypothetical protein AMSG_11954 [Thecamonas trahens ATCC 50062]|eukprot:XP_013757454.1 hypothetical protein AMSG_11954 [Thecamonas trahens ATCC 50062]